LQAEDHSAAGWGIGIKRSSNLLYYDRTVLYIFTKPRGEPLVY